MVSWVGDGLLSGFAIDNNVPEEGLNDLTFDRIHLVTAGTVDAQGVTRLQYPVDNSSGHFRNNINGYARMTFAANEVGIRPNPYYPNRGPVASYMGMVLVDAAVFPAGMIPSPAQIMAVSPSQAVVTSTTDPAPAGTSDFFFPRGFELAVNRKYWVLMLPVYRDTEDNPNGPLNGIYPIGDPNVNGRAVSVWGNRSPKAPTIVSPTADVVINAGQTFDLTFAPNDPDAFPGAGSQVYTDCAGVQVQYARRPTADNPDVDWVDLPIATRTGGLAAGAGWYIDKSNFNAPTSLANSGAYYFWALGTMKVKGGSNILDAGAGILPAGDWQIRVRTFDYGHPYPRWWQPLGYTRSPGNFSAYSFPETNTSPWSVPFKVSVSSQTPPPVPLSPVNNVALAVDQPVTLSWKYRNTALPPVAQGRREVDIRKVGDAAWTRVADSYLPATTYTLRKTAVAPGPPVTHEYLADGGFETTVDGWTPTAANSSVIRVGGSVHSGSWALMTTGTGKYIRIAKTVALPQESTFKFAGWTAAGPNTLNHSFQWLWYDSANNILGGDETVFANQAEGVWTYHEVTFTKPIGATSLKIVAGPYDLKASGAGTTSAGDRFDDFSLSASIPASSETPFIVEAGKQYEWRVRTTDMSGAVSTYSPTARFWVVPTPASGIVRPAPTLTTQAATLGIGTHRAFIYKRGGKVRVGELTGLSYVDWERKRDDISTAKVVVSDWDIDSGNLLEKLEPWAYELVLFRDNGYGTPKRVWEGPLMLPTYESDKVTINAKDVMVYPYRRIIKQLMNDSSKGDTVTSRAARILMNVLAPDDPNLLSYLTIIADPADPKQYRNIPAWSRTAFEEIDDMAANSGLDYTAVGRRIILWGTKNRIGTLPEFRDENLGSSPIVSVYGMSMANVYGVSDGAGVFGSANRLNADGVDPFYGLVEMLSSSWASDSPEDTGTYTQAGLATTAESFAQSSERSISHRYPPPVVVRIPDNTTLNPNTVLDIQQLVPGSVVPLRSTSTLRKVVADQKLDSMKVVETGGSEKITIVLSPFSRDDAGTEEADA